MFCNWKHGKGQYGNIVIYGYEKKLKTNHTLLCIISKMRNEIGNNQVKVALHYVFNHKIIESKKKHTNTFGFSFRG